MPFVGAAVGANPFAGVMSSASSYGLNQAMPFCFVDREDYSSDE